jgi:ABC-2 type transport system permease protein
VIALATMRSTLRGGLAEVRRSLLVQTQYRANMAIWTIASVLQIVVYLSVWSAVADATGSTGGYTASTFAGYFLVLLLVREFTYSWVPYMLADDVRSGRLSTRLMKPLHPIAQLCGDMVSHRIYSVTLLVPIAAILAVTFDASIDARPWAIAVAAIVLPLAALVRLLVDSLFALTSMWLVRIDGIRNMYYLLLLLLGGQFAPIDVLPQWLQPVALALPFYWTLGYPTELLVGRASIDDAWIGIAVLAAWAVGTLAVLQPAWRASTRAYEAVGT